MLQIIQKNLKFKLNGFAVSAIVDHLLYADKIPPDVLMQNFHYHAIYELFIVEDVPLTVYTETGTTVYQSCIVCIPPFLKHRTMRKCGLRILFSLDTRNKSGPFGKFMRTFLSAQAPVVLQTSAPLSFYATQLSSILSLDTPTTNEIAASLVQLIFYSIFSANSECKTNASKNVVLATNESYLARIDVMIDSFAENINLRLVADRLGLSTKQASRIIKKNYKKTLSQLVCEKRLSVAAELLLRSDKTILEIVEYVHFPSESYFYHKFKEHFGQTPLAYKKQHRAR